MKKLISASTFLTVLLFACSQPSEQKEPSNDTPAADTIPMPGSDRDEHGCIASAGYQWSKMKNECVRIFEAGIRLDPAAPADGSAATLSAFVILKEDMSQAELFVPGQAESTILARTEKTTEHTWESGNWQLTHSKSYELKEGGKVLYRGE